MSETSTQVATVARSSQQQVVTTTPARTPLASRLFSKSGHVDSEAPAQRVATQAEIAEYHATIARHEATERAETAARMKPEHAAMAQKLFQAFKSPQLETWVTENGLGGNLWAHDFLGRIWMHLSSVEQERDALRREVAALRGRRY